MYLEINNEFFKQKFLSVTFKLAYFRQGTGWNPGRARAKASVRIARLVKASTGWRQNQTRRICGTNVRKRLKNGWWPCWRRTGRLSRWNAANWGRNASGTASSSLVTAYTNSTRASPPRWRATAASSSTKFATPRKWTSSWAVSSESRWWWRWAAVTTKRARTTTASVWKRTRTRAKETGKETEKEKERAKEKGRTKIRTRTITIDEKEALRVKWLSQIEQRAMTIEVP